MERELIAPLDRLLDRGIKPQCFHRGKALLWERVIRPDVFSSSYDLLMRLLTWLVDLSARYYS